MNNLPCRTTAISIPHTPSILVRLSLNNPQKSIIIPFNLKKEIEKEENLRANRPEEYIVDTSNFNFLT